MSAETKPRKDRAPNEPPDSGVIFEVQTIEPVPDDPTFDVIPANRATDSELVWMLARRGYDIRVKVPTAKSLQRRRVEAARSRAWREKQRAAMAKAAEPSP